MASNIKIENLGVKFQLYHERMLSFQELFVNFRRFRNSREDFWALRNIDMAVEKGEVVGIIGPNGSGKSTLLRTIVNIIRPTEGKVTVEGKVSALIELGAGFDPELTGRENIYLNGSLYGLTKREIDEKYDGIVSFSELEQFIDVAVKNYSSGMYAKLGFSIAIDVNPDILLIDEVLAVGDEAFQKKCLGRLEEFQKDNKTIVIVSHSMETIEKMCDRVYVLLKGNFIYKGDPKDAVEVYRQLS